MKHLYLLGLLLACTTLTVRAQDLLENFEDVNKIEYDARSTGALDSGFANAVSGGINTSPFIGKYVRSSSTQYDVIVCNLRGIVQDVASYASGAKKLSMKVYSTAPVGTRIEFTLQNNALSTGPNYPTGRHSLYHAVTATSMAWETLTFSFDQILSNVDPTSLDQLIISFNNNSFTGDLYYFDDIKGPALGGAVTVPNHEYLWTNFTNNQNLFYRGSDGAPSKAANPSKTGGHTADTVGKYVRSGVQYDVLRYGWAGPLKGLDDYRANAKKFSLNVYSPAAGTTIQFTLQDSTKAKGNYPNGRFGEFLGTTKGANTWERVTLSWANTPDASVQNADVNELAILFNSNTFAPITVYMDSIFGPTFALVGNKIEHNAIPFVLSPNPASDYIDILLANTAQPIVAEVFTLQGQAIWKATSQPNATSLRVETAQFAKGLYQCRVTTSQGTTVSRFAVQ